MDGLSGPVKAFAEQVVSERALSVVDHECNQAAWAEIADALMADEDVEESSVYCLLVAAACHRGGGDTLPWTNIVSASERSLERPDVRVIDCLTMIYGWPSPVSRVQAAADTDAASSSQSRAAWLIALAREALATTSQPTENDVGVNDDRR